MTAARYTPGPWFPTKDSSHNEVCRVGRAWNISTKLALSDFGDVDADATLIAASPDLLDELRVARAALVDLAGLTEPHARALARRFEAAIAKATGCAPGICTCGPVRHWECNAGCKATGSAS